MTTVSVVIPTIVRDPGLLSRAVQSALDQTTPPFEVIVVVDRPECAENVNALPGMTIIVNPGPHGPAAARNIGVRGAAGELVAFLDDDDHWHLTKLATQVDALIGEGLDIVACRAAVVSPWGEWVMPTDVPSAGQRLTDFLFVEHGLFRARSRGIATPSLLVRRELLIRDPFDESLHNWEDIDWLLRVLEAGARFRCLPETLLTVELGGPGTSQSAGGSADAFQDWALRRLGPLDERAMRDFTLTYVVPQLVREGRRGDAASSLLGVLTSGRCSPRSVAKAATALALSQRMRRLLTGVSSGSFRSMSASEK